MSVFPTTSTKGTRDQLWWERTRRCGRTAYWWRCVSMDGLIQGAVAYLLLSGTHLLFGGAARPADGIFEVPGMIFWLCFFALWAYAVGIIQWNRYTRKYPLPSAAADSIEDQKSLATAKSGGFTEFDY